MSAPGVALLDPQQAGVFFVMSLEDFCPPSDTNSASPESKIIALPVPNFCGSEGDRVAMVEPAATLPSHGSMM